MYTSGLSHGIHQTGPGYTWYQLAAQGHGTKKRARLGLPIFGRENFILKTMMFRGPGVTTVLNERKHLKMVIRSVPDSVSLILGRTE